MIRDYKDSCVNETKASAYWIVAGIELAGVMREIGLFLKAQEKTA